MSSRTLILVLLLGLSLGVSAQTQTSAPTLEERMSQDEFNAAGLDKLSPEQLKFLNEWIQSKGVSAIGAPIRKADGTTEFYVDNSSREIIESVIVGKFKGWTGKTKVKLENGQVWQQAESGKSGFPMESPRVKVKPMSLGSWLMYIDGCGCDIRVKRVE
ncbi:MAG: hypothetical protein EYC71_08040 [Gammaproteobacteria bacterium]|nr:MAG: hypothetical protein EYC71_08040 [Gammaproteobacteria bacterium]